MIVTRDLNPEERTKFNACMTIAQRVKEVDSAVTHIRVSEDNFNIRLNLKVFFFSTLFVSSKTLLKISAWTSTFCILSFNIISPITFFLHYPLVVMIVLI